MANKKNKNKLYPPQLNFINPSSVRIKSVRLTEKQKHFLNIALDPQTNIIFINGPAGSTKTFMAVYAALCHLSNNPDLDLLYVRTIIESADKGIGALPGAVEEKFNPYMAPLNDKLTELLPSNTTIKRELIEQNRVQAIPINFLRGANWINQIVVADEAQNFSYKELVTLITRIGKGTKLFVCGDFMQSDINGKSGFKQITNLFNDSQSRAEGIHCFTFNAQDIKRSKILKYIISRLEKV